MSIYNAVKCERERNCIKFKTDDRKLSMFYVVAVLVAVIAVIAVFVVVVVVVVILGEQ